jgi:hypothetical protein
MENKTGKYFKYAIGEIILVMIGILLALQVNNWNESRLEKIQEKAILSNLNQEFKQNKMALSSALEYNEKCFQTSIIVMNLFGKSNTELKAINIDSLINRTLEYDSFRPSENTISDLLQSGRLQLLQNEKLKDLRQIIWNSFCSYVDNVLEVENEFYLCNSWCTYQKTNQFHPPHNHSNAIFSSVLYLQTEESELQFINNKSKIQEGFNFEYKVKNFNYFNSANWSMPVEQGDLLIFPGELNHRTFPYQGQKERIVIGCSYFLQGELGNDSNYNSINIQNNHTRY